MKQTVSILIALIAVVLLATGMIVITNMELSRHLESCENQLLQAQSDLADARTALHKTEEERDALRKQFQEDIAQQAFENQQLIREWENLEQAYQTLIATCTALEKELQAKTPPVSEPAPAAASPIRRPWILTEY